MTGTLSPLRRSRFSQCRFGKMLPWEKGFAIPRNSAAPPETPMPQLAAGDQQEEPVLGRAPADLEFSCLHFQNFVYQEAAGPHQALAQLYELCCQWLQSEVHSKERILELLVLEQFLNILPNKVWPWVVAQHPESCKKAASLVEDLTKALEEPACPAPDPVLREQGSIGEGKTEEAKPMRTELKKLKFLEETLYLGEWGRLDPAEENLNTYQKLLLWGYQLAQPDAPCRLETEKLWLVDRELPEGSFSGGGRWQENRESLCEEGSMYKTLMERLTREVFACPLMGTAWEEDEQLQKALDSQDGEPGPVTTVHGQSVIWEPAQDRGTAGESLTVSVTLATPPQGLGRKRPYPEDVGGQGHECFSSMSHHQQFDVKKEPAAAGQGTGSLASQARGTSAASCPAADEPGASRGKPYACSECGETFAWISHFVDHLRSHRPEALRVPGMLENFPLHPDPG